MARYGIPIFQISKFPDFPNSRILNSHAEFQLQNVQELHHAQELQIKNGTP